MAKASLLLSAALLLWACAAPTAHALSNPVCADGGSTWVTERPTTDPRFPGAGLWFFCDRGLNILGDSVDPCLSSGATCTPAVNDAICKLLGYDKAFGPSTSVAAQPGEVVRSLSGEYCLRRGNYAATLPDNLASLPGEPCMRIDSITCVRTHQHMADSLESIVMEAAMAPPASPATEGLAAPAQPTVSASDGPPNGGGRKLKL